MIAKSIVIFDIDGTLADCEARVRYLKEGKKDWQKFYAECSNDTPIADNIHMAQLLQGMGYSLVFCTGRPNTYRKQTSDWLRAQSLTVNNLLMRPSADRRADYIVKRELVSEMGYTPREVLCIFEDRNQVVEMWREEGFTCYQVSKGDF